MAPKVGTRVSKFKDFASFVVAHLDELGRRLPSSPLDGDATLQERLLGIFPKRGNNALERKHYMLLYKHRMVNLSDPTWAEEQRLLQSSWGLIQSRSDDMGSENAGFCECGLMPRRKIVEGFLYRPMPGNP